ncbi:DUF397 domain-containing protein [Micromonospora sp. WMMC415]|uniref:DUF397 domain-containing protein n=1 Tax=Micromonospora sp. WMMC415 TaxID=2675222 RepID=UPI0012B4E946|nr:DUF397 domain-containing protein [Micromonospora sp. WMMC415]QGN49451.1 DUF397 domain-containing protein [Micromonospora sp. WMMC415]
MSGQVRGGLSLGGGRRCSRLARLRDTKDREGATLTFRPAAWQSFVSSYAASRRPPHAARSCRTVTAALLCFPRGSGSSPTRR